MEVAGVRHQGSYLRVRGAEPCEVSVVEREGQAGYRTHEASGRLRVRRERANVGLNPEDDAMLLSLFHPPGQLVPGPAERNIAGLGVEENARQGGQVTTATFASVLEGMEELGPGLLAARCFGMVDGKGLEITSHLKEDVGCLESEISEFLSQPAR